jgi:hypothetical protein
MNLYSRTRPALVLAAMLCLSLPVLASDVTPKDVLPKADDILKKAMARAKIEKDRKDDEKWAPTHRNINEKLAKDGTVEETIESLYQPVMISGKVYSRQVAKNGKPLDADEQKKEAEREKKFREHIAKPSKKSDDDDEDDVEFDEALIAKYNFAVVKLDAVGGRKAYELTFLPRPGVKLAEKRRMDRILNRLEGHVWFDAETFALVKLDMHLTEPTTLMAGLGSVRSLDFLMELMQVSPDVFAPSQLTIAFEGRKLFSAMRVKQKAYFSEYRKVSELAQIQ